MNGDQGGSPSGGLFASVAAMLRRGMAMGVFDLSTSMALVMILGFLQNLALARILGSEGFGSVAVVNATMGFGQLFGAIGMTVAVLRHASAESEADRAWAVYRLGLPPILASSILVALGVAFYAHSSMWAFDRVAGDWIPVLAMGLPASVLFLLNSKYLQSRERMREKALLEFTNRALIVSCVLVGTVLRGFEGFVYGSLIGILAGSALSAARVWHSRPTTRADAPVGRAELFNFGFWSVFAGVMSYVLTAADVFCVSAVTGDARLTGFYGLAVVLHRVARIPAMAYLDATFPGLVRESGTRGFSEVRTRMQHRMFGLSASTGLALTIAAPFVVPILFGEEYSASVGPLLLLLVGQILWSWAAVHGRSLVAKGFVRLNFAASSIAAGVNITANLILIPRLGIMGAAVATVLSQGVWACMVTLLCRLSESRSAPENTVK